MKISNKQLKQIIKEELNKVLNEGNYPQYPRRNGQPDDPNKAAQILEMALEIARKQGAERVSAYTSMNTDPLEELAHYIEQAKEAMLDGEGGYFPHDVIDQGFKQGVLPDVGSSDFEDESGYFDVTKRYKDGK
jgi:hypothetical protein